MSPISREEFSKGRKTLRLEASIHQFLAIHRNEAFTVGEIGRGIGAIRGVNLIEDAGATFQMNAALRALLNEKKIASKMIGGLVYYAVV